MFFIGNDGVVFMLRCVGCGGLLREFAVLRV